jgi:ABC-type phosphate transport system permease subunit
MAIVEQQRDSRIDLTGDVRRRRRESIVKALFFAAAVISILISVAIVLALIGKAWAFLTSIELNQLWGNGWFPRRGRFDLSARARRASSIVLLPTSSICRDWSATSPNWTR